MGKHETLSCSCSRSQNQRAHNFSAYSMFGICDKLCLDWSRHLCLRHILSFPSLHVYCLLLSVRPLKFLLFLHCLQHNDVHHHAHTQNLMMQFTGHILGSSQSTTVDATMVHLMNSNHILWSNRLSMKITRCDDDDNVVQKNVISLRTINTCSSLCWSVCACTTILLGSRHLA